MSDSWRIFAQGDEPHRSSQWIHHAARFFDTKIAFVGDASIDIGGAVRAVTGRLREERDLRDAIAAPFASENGLYDLAERRCGSIWVVERKDPHDKAALVLAAVIASVCLGPILGGPPDLELFGVRTAREKLLSLDGQ